MNLQLPIERAVLSAIFFDAERLDGIAEILVADDFFYTPHKNIFATMLTLRHADLPIDEEFVLKYATKTHPITQEDILNILTTSPVSDVQSYANEIRDFSTKRKLHSFATKIQEASQDDSTKTQDIIDYLQSELYKISNAHQMSDFRGSKEVSEATLAYIETMKARGNHLLIGVDTGFASLNKMTTGFGKGDLIIVAARPAMGKTTLVLNMAQKALDTGRGVAFFSLEMPAEQLMLRMLAAKTSIALQDLRVGNLQDFEWENLTKAVDIMGKSPLFIDDGSILTIHQLRTKLRKIKSKHPEIGLAVIDYLQLMSGEGNRDRHQEVSEISRGLKMIARELEIPIIALSQLNRSLESRSDRRPMLSDLRESGSIEQDADNILFVYRDAVYKQKDEKEKEEAAKRDGNTTYKSTFVPRNEEEAEIIIGKQRNGPTGTIKLVFQKHCTRFVDAENALDKPPIEIIYEGMAANTQTKFTPNDSIDAPMI